MSAFTSLFLRFERGEEKIELTFPPSPNIYFPFPLGDPILFAKMVLPRLYKHSNFESFIRQVRRDMSLIRRLCEEMLSLTFLAFLSSLPLSFPFFPSFTAPPFFSSPSLSHSRWTSTA